ncbi:MAG: hypothetical protein AAF283_12915 [Cyanobacteria bacterium P01_A01_bin.70]
MPQIWQKKAQQLLGFGLNVGFTFLIYIFDLFSSIVVDYTSAFELKRLNFSQI